MTQIFEHMRPGGYVELVETHGDVTSDDDSIPADSGIRKLFNIWRPMAQRAGLRVLESGQELVQSLQEAGFVDVKVWPWYSPVFQAC